MERKMEVTNRQETSRGLEEVSDVKMFAENYTVFE